MAEYLADLCLRLRNALTADLQPELSDVLLPLLTLTGSDAQRITITAPNALWAAAAVTHALPAAEKWAARVAPGVTIRVIDRDQSPIDEPKVELTGQTFAEFLEDPGNQIALATCRRVVENPGLEHNPLYLHGPAGSGKSHLAAAVAADYRQMLGDEAAVSLNGAEFVASAAQELARRANDGLRERLSNAAVIVIDGIDALAERALAQEELFHVMNAALDRGAQLLVTGRQPPRRLVGFTERLTSRLAWGLTVSLDAPHLETRVALVRKIAGEAVAIADVGQLTALVEAQAPDMHQAVILAQRLIRGGVELAATRAQAASFDRIVQVVAEACGLRPGDIASKSRHSEIVAARGLALLLGRRLTDHSLDALGGMVGGRDHTTVMHALRTTEARVAADPELQRRVSELTRMVLTIPGF